MNLPQLPTDNLYKFAALSGLVLSVFFYVWPSQELAKLDERRVEVSTQKNILALELKHLEEDIRALEKGESRIAQSNIELLIKRKQAIEIKDAEIRGKEALLSSLLDSFKRLFKVLVGGAALGAILMTCGFYLWYARVQKPADEAVRRRASESDA